jgi:hypothetical protein
MSRSQLSIVDGLLLSSVVKEKVKNLISPVPEYINSPEFEDFKIKFEPYINENVGYMFVVLDKEWYRPG